MKSFMVLEAAKLWPFEVIGSARLVVQRVYESVRRHEAAYACWQPGIRGKHW
jgi:hypothetical protein